MPGQPHKRPESVLVLVYAASGEVLLLRRREPEDFWQSVTGSLEWGETPEQAARRELVEETGLQADSALVDCSTTNRFPILPAWRHRYAPDQHENIEHVFRVVFDHRPAVRLDPAEHIEYRWFTRETAVSLATSCTNRDAILAWVPAIGEAREPD